MGFVYNLGSFPNSRVKARKATQDAEVKQIAIPVGPPVLIVGPNPDRTYLTLICSGVDAIEYDYDITYPNGGFILQPGEGIDLEAPGNVYARAVGLATTIEYDEGEG